MAPDHIEAALKENVRLKLEILNISKEMKKLKKLLLQQDKDLAEAQRDREGGRGGKSRDAEARELEAMWKEEKERRKSAEAELQRLQDRSNDGGDVEDLRNQLEDTEAAEAVWRQRAEQLEEELEGAKAAVEDQAEEMDRIRDSADRALEEVDKLQSEKANLGESVGVGRGREARMLQKLEQENADLQSEMEVLRGQIDQGDQDELEEVGLTCSNPLGGKLNILAHQRIARSPRCRSTRS